MRLENEWKRVDILNRLGVQRPVVLNQTEGPVLLLDEEDRCRHSDWRARYVLKPGFSSMKASSCSCSFRESG